MSKVETLEYSEDNINELKSNGYIKSPVSKPMSLNKVIRYSIKRGVYWFSNKCSAHSSDCFFTRQNVGQIIFI